MGKIIDPEEFDKLCKKDNWDEQILKANNINEIYDKINKKLKDNKRVTKILIVNRKNELEIEKISSLCKKNNLNDEILKCSDNLKEAKEKIDAVLDDGINISIDAVKEYVVKLQLNLVRENCKDSTIQNEILKCGDDFKKAKEIIEGSLTDNKKVLIDAVKKYLIEQQLELIRTLCKDITIQNKILKCVPNYEEAKKVLDNTLQNDKKVSVDAVTIYIDEYKNQILSSDTTGGSTKGERDGFYIGEEKIKELETLKTENTELKNSNQLLANENEKLKAENLILKQQLYGTAEDKNNIFAEIPELNDLLNSNNERINVTINKELLSMATRYVDNKSLVKLESIIRDGSDLSSSVVQSILLAFIKQNSLYKFKTSNK